MISSIVEKCGGLNRIDENTASLKDLRWAHFLTVKTNIRLIPRAVKISDGELSYQVSLVLEDDWEESVVSVYHLHRQNNRDQGKWFSGQ